VGKTLDDYNQKRDFDKACVGFLQNPRGQTIVPPDCVRPVPRAQVSAPLDWDELDPGMILAQFTMRRMLARVSRIGDLYRGTPVNRQGLLSAIGKPQDHATGG
jgi:bifunctional non-homologous end joining protein LigD